jgi:hypothetical protein
MNDDRASGHAVRLWHFAMIVACAVYAGACTGKIGDLMGGSEGDPTGAAANGAADSGSPTTSTDPGADAGLPADDVPVVNYVTHLTEIEKIAEIRQRNGAAN